LSIILEVVPGPKRVTTAIYLPLQGLETILMSVGQFRYQI
jgi:hypothetical protein